MRAGEPFSALSLAVGHALFEGLPDIEYEKTNWGPGGTRTSAGKAKRRPYVDEIDIRMFSQTWGSTALGFGGIGGAAMTDAYTVVVRYSRPAAVYFAGRFAYLIENPNEKFDEDLRRGVMESCNKAHAKYERQP